MPLPRLYSPSSTPSGRPTFRISTQTLFGRTPPRDRARSPEFQNGLHVPYSPPRMNGLLRLRSRSVLASLYGRGCIAVPLRGPSDDHSHDTSGQNDLEVVSVLFQSHKKREQESDTKPEENPQRHRIYFAREDSCGDSRD